MHLLEIFNFHLLVTFCSFSSVIIVVVVIVIIIVVIIIIIIIIVIVIIIIIVGIISFLSILIVLILLWAIYNIFWFHAVIIIDIIVIVVVVVVDLPLLQISRQRQATRNPLTRRLQMVPSSSLELGSPDHRHLHGFATGGQRRSLRTFDFWKDQIARKGEPSAFFPGAWRSAQLLCLDLAWIVPCLVCCLCWLVVV